MWGVGGLGTTSYRKMIAELSDSLGAKAAASVKDVADRWCDAFWPAYTGLFAPAIARFRDLSRINPRSEAEERELVRLQQVSGGFCIGGYVLSDRTPKAFEMIYGPHLDAIQMREISFGEYAFWGCPNSMQRLIFGIDGKLFQAIIDSKKWSGTPEELFAIVQPQMLGAPGALPLREAVDWVYSTIFVTIKAMKFSWLSQVCGGPIEVAVVSADRNFRWVSHKGLDEAISHRPYSQRPVARRDSQ
jgi:hypothetical protein